jgi:V/A-type H+-transporting ATPase subunit K
MDLGNLGYFAALALSGMGSAAGMAISSLGTIGAWKKAYMSGKNANMSLLAFAGAPISQLFYGYILMGQLRTALDAGVQNTAALGMIGILGGIAMGYSSMLQGKLGAAACDSQGETGKGFGLYLVTIGLVETVALFVLVFGILQINALS